MNIKSLANSERPREKMCVYGPDQLSTLELIAIVIQSGSKKESALSLAGQVIELLDHGIEDLSDITIEELLSLQGIGRAKACQILAAVELGKRVNIKPRNMLGKINSPTTVVDFFKKELKNQNKEKFIVVFLNTKNIITSYEIISVGSLSASIVHPREVFNRAIKKSAASIILVHNHPSGNPTPSQDDEVITKRLVDVGELVGIKILDHVIISEERYFSFKEMAMI